MNPENMAISPPFGLSFANDQIKWVLPLGTIAHKMEFSVIMLNLYYTFEEGLVPEVSVYRFGGVV